MAARLVPGMRVRHPGEPDWGVGQVQSVIGPRVTVNFEHAGKRLINAAVVELQEIDDTDPPPTGRPGIDPPGRGC
jgi:FKBP-type peptidyl-prolyl cis-trans isomerase 2